MKATHFSNDSERVWDEAVARYDTPALSDDSYSSPQAPWLSQTATK